MESHGILTGHNCTNPVSPRFDLTVRMSESAQERVLAVTKEGSAGNFSPISNLSNAKDLQAFQHSLKFHIF